MVHKSVIVDLQAEWVLLDFGVYLVFAWWATLAVRKRTRTKRTKA